MVLYIYQKLKKEKGNTNNSHGYNIEEVDTSNPGNSQAGENSDLNLDDKLTHTVADIVEE